MGNRDDFKVYEGVFEKVTFQALERLTPKYFDRLIGPISTGKEADVYLAEKDGKRVALKIYRVMNRTYKGIDVYIRDDPRFHSLSHNPRLIIYEWTKKEFKNLARASDAGVRVPKPIAFFKNVLVMEFIGEEDTAYPTAKQKPPKKPEAWKNTIYKWIKMLWDEKSMVHGDLSEYNIINYREKPVIIDISQAVLKQHPLSLKLLKRDVDNITNWFKRQGVNDSSLQEWLTEVIKKVNEDV